MAVGLLAGLLALALVLVLSLAGVGIMLLPSRQVKHSPAARESVRVQVLVLGDIGRSPRMQYHALSIARHGGKVDLVGYNESPPHPDIVASSNIQIHGLAPPPAVLRSKSIPFILAGPLKVLWQLWSLFRVLGYATEPARWLLVQNPPSIPTLAVALAMAVLRNTHLMIDWHNYGWTILAGTRGARHPFVRISKAYECILGRAAPTANITVTHAMARQLQEAPYRIKSPIITLHDRPASIFQPLASEAERRAFLERLPETRDVASSIMSGHSRLVVSSTSWTPDEDFSLLLDALVEYAQQQPGGAPPLTAVITGKGPQKAHYEARVRQLEAAGRLPGVRVRTAWLSLADYARLLASADLGVCLHMSSSGVDLPMKVVDMFGAGLPVAAYARYESFAELVREGVNGCGFATAPELAAVLRRLFAAGPAGADELRVLRAGAVKEGSLRWDEEWDRVVGRAIGVISE